MTIFWILPAAVPILFQRRVGIHTSRKEPSNMKRVLLSVVVASVVAALTGCSSRRGCSAIDWIKGSCAGAPENCASCTTDCGTTDCDSCGDAPCQCEGTACSNGVCQLDGTQYRESLPPGPPTGAVAYPYYTNRGPRDFLARDPQSIGP